jgi:integral membrane protein (TIGR01906 family)
LENKTYQTLIRWLVILAMPFFLGFGMIRAVIAWDYPAFEYQRIPPDIYGFSPEQRLELARGTLNYMQQTEPAESVIYMLEELRLPGTDQSLYNDREIQHMIDVKRLADAIRIGAIIAGMIVFVGLGVLIIPKTSRLFGWRTLMLAGMATMAALAIIAVSILIAWPIFFVQFHELLFPPDTWTFAYTDSLIRLFPEQFWFDVGVIISVGTLVLGALAWLIGYVMYRRGTKKSAELELNYPRSVQ